MKSTFLIAILLCTIASAADKKPPQGHGEDGAVSIAATLLSPEQLKQSVGSDFNNEYTAIEITVMPKAGKPYLVHLDDFILRSEASGEHSGPFTSPGQIAGSSNMQVERVYGNRENPDSPRPVTGTKLHMKEDEKADPALAPLKQKMLAEKTITEPVTGLLFFPVKDKPKNLILSCKTPESHLRLNFK
jgi:hypothetical protein